MEIAEPMPDKCVIIMYPHTSNWDFPIGLLTAAIGLTRKRDALSFAGKESLSSGRGLVLSCCRWVPGQSQGIDGFRWPNGDALRCRAADAICDRPGGHAQLCTAHAVEFLLRGGRRPVPIALGAFDYPGKRVVVDTFLTPCGDPEADLPPLTHTIGAWQPRLRVREGGALAVPRQRRWLLAALCDYGSNSDSPMQLSHVVTRALLTREPPTGAVVRRWRLSVSNRSMVKCWRRRAVTRPASPCVARRNASFAALKH